MVRAITKAASQLPKAPLGPNLIAVSASRRALLSLEPQCLVTDLIGETSCLGGVVTLPRSGFGKFWAHEWRHVAGVVLLDLHRGWEDAEYTCTVLLNPEAERRASPEWFPRASVLVVVDGTFQWIGGEPGHAHTLPDGSAIAD